ncbi:MAG: hypothetical protein ABW218_01065, partial [Casimicrobiaceae bacterium]
RAAGYSGKPLWQKLGLASGMRVYVADPPENIDTLLAGAPRDLARLARLGACDVALVFVTARRAVEAAVARVTPQLVRLKPDLKEPAAPEPRRERSL